MGKACWEQIEAMLYSIGKSLKNGLAGVRTLAVNAQKTADEAKQTADEAQTAANTLDWNGVGWFTGGVKVGGATRDEAADVMINGSAEIELSSSDGTRYKIGVDDNGALAVKGAARTCVTVAKKGAMYSSISEAVEYAKTICSQTERVLVLILDAGIYDEEITLLSNPGIDIAGFGAVIRHDSVYPKAPLYTTGRGTFSGLVFENYNTTTGANPSYAMHFDFNNPGANASGETRFVNCRFVAIGCHGAGIGLGPDIDLIFDNCFFRSITNAGLYLHNSPAAATNQVVRLNNCQFFGAETADGASIIFDDAVDVAAGAISYMSVYMNGCGFMPMTPNVIVRNGAQTTTYRGLVKTHNLNFNVQGCLLPHYNPVNLDNTAETSFTYVTNTNENGHATIVKPSPMPAQTTVTILSCDVNDGTTITPEIVSDAGQMCAVISTGKPNAVLQLTVRLLPTGLV